MDAIVVLGLDSEFLVVVSLGWDVGFVGGVIC